MQLYIYDTKVTFQGEEIMEQRTRITCKHKPVPYWEPSHWLWEHCCCLLPHRHTRSSCLGALESRRCQHVLSKWHFFGKTCLRSITSSGEQFRNWSWLWGFTYSQLFSHGKSLPRQNILTKPLVISKVYHSQVFHRSHIKGPVKLIENLGRNNDLFV